MAGPVVEGSETASAVINNAIDFMQGYSIQAPTAAGTFKWAHTPDAPIDFDKLREEALASVAKISNPTAIDAARAIDKALVGLGDGHSLLTCAGYRRGHEEEYHRPPLKQPMPEATWHEGNVLQLTVPFFTSSDEGERKKYQDIMKDALNDAAARGVRAVILDLRDNGGGAMCPMMNGLSPLLGPGTLGYFAGPEGETGFNVNWGAPPQHKIDLTKADNFKLTGTPVAVLAGKNTCSSGEITFLSLSGRPNTQSFGEATFGSSSGNMSVPLSLDGQDTGIYVHLCTSICVDRNKQGDGGPIKPDVATADPLKSALQWVDEVAPARGPAAAPQRRLGQ
jgi:carboxyl-terminal processing protease